MTTPPPAHTSGKSNSSPKLLIALAILLALAAGGVFAARRWRHQDAPVQAAQVAAPATSQDKPMAQRMQMTPLRPKTPQDIVRADAVVAAARKAVAPYGDFHNALKAGYQPYMPELPMTEVHFINVRYAQAAEKRFDPSKPPFLLYDKIPVAPGSPQQYKLTGIMYMAQSGATQDDMDHDIPTSIARWHAHNKFCYSSESSGIDYPGNEMSYKMIVRKPTEEKCAAAGGHMVSQSNIWMTHVYPTETDPARVFRTTMDEEGDHHAMAGMNMDAPAPTH